MAFSAETTYTLNEIDTPPEFPQGINALHSYLNKHSNYPCTISEEGNYPPIILIIEIDKDGKMVYFKIKEPSDGGFERAIINAMPFHLQWKPGTINGQPVKVRFELELKYDLTENSANERTSAYKKDSWFNEFTKGKGPLIFMGIIFIVLLITRVFKNVVPENEKGFFSFLIPAIVSSGQSLFKRKLTPEEESILLNKYGFYKTLSAKNRKKFGHRVNQFINDKNFEGREDLTITPEMQLLIAASAIRITFGLHIFDFPSFHTILVYPDLFYSAISKVQVKGETHGAGYVVFSWKAFQFGLSDDNDNLNLGYHEFGHALFVERFKENIDNSFMDYYDEWRKLLITQSKLQEAKLKKTFRDYATYNEHEFFAVAIENFFERPEKYKTDLPQLYLLMTKMLNQDPLQKIKSGYNRVKY